MGVLGWMRHRRHERRGFELYATAVQAARDPVMFRDLGVPDTLDGRFDMIGLFVFLAIRRVQRIPRTGPALAQAVFDAMFSDMDSSLREVGVGDLSVGKKVRAMWEAFHGRSRAYEAALEAGSPDELADALSRNVWRGAAPVQAAARLATIALRQDRHLTTQPDAALQAGQIDFASAGSAADAA